MTKKRKLSDIDRLYEELFGSTAKKRGAAYEMLSAIVLAVLGWEDVVHVAPTARKASAPGISLTSPAVAATGQSPGCSSNARTGTRRSARTR